jgi:hypothetical protein
VKELPNGFEVCTGAAKQEFHLDIVLDAIDGADDSDNVAVSQRAAPDIDGGTVVRSRAL